jgi:pimeloyl-ACP methyl ester carboxylesterase
MRVPSPRRRSKNSNTAITVQRVYDGDIYARVNTIGTDGVRPFVLVPGIGVSSAYFERLAPRLNEFGPVHALDLPGFGGVPHPDSAMTIRQYADLLGKVIDDLELEDPIVVGHSMGTQVVADLASRRPELSTIVLIGPVVNPNERKVVTQARRFLQASWHEPLSVKVIAIGAYLFCGVKWFSRILPEMMHYRVEDALPRIQAHALIIRGEYDAVAPRDWVRTMGDLLPSARLWEIPGAAHSVMHKQAEEVARLCVEHARESAGEPLPESTTAAAAVAPDETDSSGSVPLRIAEDVERADAAPPDPADVIAGIRGRLVEAVGVIRDDDELVERGKTEHAEALHKIENPDGSESANVAGGAQDVAGAHDAAEARDAAKADTDTDTEPDTGGEGHRG